MNCQKIRPYLQWTSTTVTKKVAPPLSDEWALCMFLSQCSPFFYKIEPLVTYTRNIILFIHFISGCFERYGKCFNFKPPGKQISQRPPDSTTSGPAEEEAFGFIQGKAGEVQSWITAKTSDDRGEELWSQSLQTRGKQEAVACSHQWHLIRINLINLATFALLI